jgi:hypothetical protein
MRSLVLNDATGVPGQLEVANTFAVKVGESYAHVVIVTNIVARLRIICAVKFSRFSFANECG